MGNTATEQRSASLRIDIRRRRADVFLHHIMHCIGPHLREDANLSRIADDILRQVYDAGAEIITDSERARLGLPPRNLDGWTDAELVAMESLRLELMLKPLSTPVERMG